MCGRFVTITRDELARALREMGLNRIRADETHLGALTPMPAPSPASAPSRTPAPSQPALPLDGLDSAAAPTAAPVATHDAFPGMACDILLPDTEGQGLLLTDKTWGYQVGWTPKLVYNARAEKALDLSSFWADSLAYRRCIVPSRGFFEPDASRRLHLFEAPAGTPLFMAAIYADDRFSILTCEPNKWVAPIHHRMPVVLPAHADALTAWLSGDYAALLDCRARELVVN